MTEKFKTDVGVLLQCETLEGLAADNPRGGDETGLSDMRPAEIGKGDGNESFASVGSIRTGRGGLGDAPGLLPGPERPEYPPRKHAR